MPAISHHCLAICKQYGIDPDAVPQHVAVICDGNGRWAKARGLPRIRGHAAGEEALWDTVKGALEIGVKWITVFVFSTENWQRPDDEVGFLMKFNRDVLTMRREEANTYGIRVRVLGRRGAPIPEDVLVAIRETEEMTADNKKMTLNFCFNYGGRAEIVDAVRTLAAEVAAGTLSPEEITESHVAARLYAPDVPDPDLWIRTSGELRLSNFLLWEAAYAELVFVPVLWPDYRREHLYQAIAEFQSRHRRYGDIDR